MKKVLSILAALPQSLMQSKSKLSLQSLVRSKSGSKTESEPESKLSLQSLVQSLVLVLSLFLSLCLFQMPFMKAAAISATSETATATAPSSEIATAAPSEVAVPSETLTQSLSYEQAPDAPSLLVVESGIRLEWDAIDGVLGYRVYRSAASGMEGVSITDFYITDKSFVDVNVDANTMYYYTVRAVLGEADITGTREQLSAPSEERSVMSGSSILGGDVSALDVGTTKNVILMKVNDPYMSVNGFRQEIDFGRGTTPIIQNGRTLVPIRAIIEAMDGTVGWEDATQKITLAVNDNVVEMWLNKRDLVVDGVSKEMDIAPASVNGRTMVPVRFAVENVGCDVDWISGTQEVVVVFVSDGEAPLTPPLVTVTPDSSYTAIHTEHNVLYTEDEPLKPDFVKPGATIFLNEYEAIVADKAPGATGLGATSTAGLSKSDNFAWVEIEGGGATLMILVDTDEPSGSSNNALHLPKYGNPVIGRVGYRIYIDWAIPEDPNDAISLMFEEESNIMAIHANTPQGIIQTGDSGTTEMAASVVGDGSGHRYYIPLYAILNQTGGGVLNNPFPLGDTTAFIFTGDVLQGYSGVWEVSDNTEYRVYVEMDGKTVSVGNYWQSLELSMFGAFKETNRYYQDEGDWVMRVDYGDYAFFGRILAMNYISYSEFRGKDINNLLPVIEGAPYDGWGASGDDGGIKSLYAYYADSWGQPEILDIRGWNTFYSKELSGREW